MASKPLVLPSRWTQQPQQPVRPDSRFGATFAWLASSPGLDLVSGATQTALGVAAVNSQGLYRDLTGNAATQSFATPLPQAKYTIITVFVPRASVAVSMPVQTTTNGFRVDITTTAGGLNPYQATNKGVANGPGLVTSTTFDNGSWVGITTYDAVTMRSWIKKLGSAEFQTGSVVMGYAAPSGTLDIGGQQGIQAIVLTPNALPDSVVLDLLSNPWQLFQAPARRVWVAAAAGGAGVGSATGTSTVTGVSASTAAGVGSAAGTSTASAVGQAAGGGTGVGSASGTSTVSGIGAATAAAAGSAAGASTATGIAPTIAQGVGSASGSSTASGISANQAGVFGGVPFFHSEYANTYRRKKAEEEDVSDAQPVADVLVTAEPDLVEIEVAVEQIAAPSALSKAKAKAKRELQAELKRQEAAYQKLQAKQLDEQFQRQAEEQRNAQMIQELQALIQMDLEEQDEEEAMLLLM